MSITSAKSGATGISLALDNNFMEPIASTLVGSGGANIVIFNDIPQTYKHLQIRYNARNAAATDTVLARFNSDSGTNYAWHSLRGTGTATQAVGTSSQTRMEMPFNAYSGTTANAFGVAIIDVLDYANTNKNKTLRALGGADLNGSGYLFFESGLWMNTAAITTFEIYPESGNFAQYSRFSLYGIRG